MLDSGRKSNERPRLRDSLEASYAQHTPKYSFFKPVSLLNINTVIEGAMGSSHAQLAKLLYAKRTHSSKEGGSLVSVLRKGSQSVVLSAPSNRTLSLGKSTLMPLASLAPSLLHGNLPSCKEADCLFYNLSRVQAFATHMQPPIEDLILQIRCGEPQTPSCLLVLHHECALCNIKVNLSPK